jgi:AcrR family transcriptional regulator
VTDRADPATPTPTPSRRGVERALAPKRRQYQAEFDQLVAAARTVICDSGTVDATIGQILAEAGYSTNAFYRHFPSKDALLLELVTQAGANTRSFLEHRLRPLDQPADRIRAWIEGMFSLIGAKAALRANRPFLVAHPRLVERFPDDIEASITLLIRPLVDALAELPDPPAEPAHDARLVYHQVFGILLDRAARNELRDRAEVGRTVAYTLRALGAAI